MEYYQHYHLPDIRVGTLTCGAMRRESILDYEGSKVIVTIHLDRIGRDPFIHIPGKIINFQQEIVSFKGIEYGVSEVEPIKDERVKAGIIGILRERGFNGKEKDVYF